MPTNHGGDRVIRPHIARVRIGKLAELAPVVLSRAAVRQPAVRAAARGVHSQRNVPTFGPVFRPIAKRLSAPAMNEHHRRKRPFTFRWSANVRKDAGWFSTKRLTVIIDLLYQPGARSPFRGGSFLQFDQLPRTGVAGGSRRRGASVQQHQTNEEERRAAKIWSAVTRHRFRRFGDLSPKTDRALRPGEQAGASFRARRRQVACRKRGQVRALQSSW